MRSHLRHAIPREPFSPSDASESRTSSDMGKSSDYSTLFKENFCVAAKDLADLIQEPLEDIGVLYGGIMNTGTLSKAAKLKYHGLKIRNKTIEAAERGESPIVFGRGQLLFLVRQANRAESSRLQAVGHRFAAMPNVIGSLARSMEVTCEELIPQLESMRDSASDEHLLAPGVHLAYFAIRPVLRRGFDILVRKDASNLIPTIPFRKSKLEQWQLDILSGMNNLTVATCCDMLGEKTKLEYKREQKFADELLKGILQLAEIVGDPFFLEARLVARPLMAPCSPSNKYGSQQQALLITFSNMIDAHQNNATNARLHFAPMKLFVCQQRAYKGCPDNGFFAKKIYEEFAALVEPSDDHYHRVSADGPHYRNRSSIDTFQSMSDASPSPAKKKTWPSRVHVKGFDVHNDNSSAKHLVSPGSVKLYGGINVSSEIDIDNSEVSRESHGSDIEMKKLGGASEFVVADTEVETFADVLVHITVNDRKKQPAVAL